MVKNYKSTMSITISDFNEQDILKIQLLVNGVVTRETKEFSFSEKEPNSSISKTPDMALSPVV